MPVFLQSKPAAHAWRNSECSMRLPSAPIRASSRGAVPARRSSVAIGCAMLGAMGASGG